MSHFLDRLTHFAQPTESFSGDHGVVTGEAFRGLCEMRETVQKVTHGFVLG